MLVLFHVSHANTYCKGDVTWHVLTSFGPQCQPAVPNFVSGCQTMWHGRVAFIDRALNDTKNRRALKLPIKVHPRRCMELAQTKM